MTAPALSKAARQALAYTYATGRLPSGVQMATRSALWDLAPFIEDSGRRISTGRTYDVSPAGLEAIGFEPWKLAHDYLTAGGFKLVGGARGHAARWLDYRHESDERTATVYRGGRVMVRPSTIGLKAPFPLPSTYAEFGKRGAVPVDLAHPVRPLEPGEARTRSDSGDAIASCGACGRSWDDGEATAWTPAPSGRCPFEYFHNNA